MKTNRKGTETGAVAVEASGTTESPAKTRLTKKQLEYFRELLLQRRAEILGDVQSMENEALHRNDSGNLSHLPLHLADAGSDTYEQEFTLQLAASERELLREIEQAIQRIDNGTYGICEESGKPIGLPRLEAKPWARYCIEVARERERKMGHGMAGPMYR